MRNLHLAALLGLLVLGAMPLCAEFPAHRVRLKYEHMMNPLPPELYPDNRVMVRNFNVELAPTGAGIRIRGEVWTDFEVEGGRGLPAGQMTGLKVDVSLSEMRSPTEVGAQVPTQFVTTTVTRVQDELGLAAFELPVLSKPLPPGLYQLQVMVIFGVQDPKLQQGLKWCQHWYGGWTEQDDKGQVIATGRIYDSPERHEAAYQSLLRSTKSVKGTALLYVGQMRQASGNLDFGRPGAETYLCQDRNVDVTTELLMYEQQRKDSEEQIKKQREDLRKQINAEKDAEKKKKLESALTRAEDMYKLALTSTEKLTNLNGGKLSKEEIAEHARVGAVRTRILQQIENWEDSLREKYWLLLDGYVWYKAYNAIVHPGYNTMQGIKLQDNAQDRKAREEAIEKRKNDAAAKAAWDKQIADQSNHLPDKIRETCIDYYRKLESADWDSAKFLSRAGTRWVLNTRAWRTHVIAVAQTCLNETRAVLEEMNTENHYCMLKWPDAYAQAKAARDAVLSLGFAYEFSMRVNEQKEDVQAVTDDLNNLAANNPTLEEYIKAASASGHSGLQSRVSSNMRASKEAVRLRQFIDRWKKTRR